MKIKRTVLAMALTVPLVCGAAFGSLPGRDVMLVQAEEGGEALEAPVYLGWTGWAYDYTPVNGIGIGSQPTGIYFLAKPNTCYEVELYRDGVLVESNAGDEITSSAEGYCVNYNRFAVNVWCTNSADGSLYQTRGPKHNEEGIWTYRARAVSTNEEGEKVYSDWSDFSWGLDNSKETYLAHRASLASTGNESEVPESSDDDTDDSNDTVTASSGEVVTSASTIYVNSITPAVVRTPQSGVNAAVAGAVGGFKEGQSVAATVGDSQCGELARQAVTNAAASVSGKVVSYLEITIDIYTPGEPSQQVTQLSSPIEFMLAAPKEIDGNQYDFAVIRLHGDGRVDILPDLDSDPSTITFQTDRFSVYAVIYGPKGSFKSSGGKDRVPKTGDSTVPVLPFAAAGTVCAGAAIVLKKKERA